MLLTEKRDFWLSVTILGAVIGIFGGLFIAVAMFSPALRVKGLAVALAGSGLWLVILGATLMWAGGTAYRGYPELRIHASKVLPWSIGLSGFLLVLVWLLPEQAQTSPLFAFVHLGALALPGAIILLIIIWAGGKALAPTVRQITLALSGSLLSLLLALPVEAISLVLSSLVVAVCALFIPGGQTELHHLMDSLQQWQTSPPNPEEVYALVLSPIVWSVFALTLAVITPLIEELVKTLLAAAMIWREDHPSLLQAFVWGAACGIGFSILEGVSSGAFELGHTLQWGGGLLFRSLATLMHAFTGGLTGIGWGMARKGRWWVWPLLYFTAVSLHGLWNLSVLLMLQGASETPDGTLLSMIGMGLWGILIVIAGAGSISLPWSLRPKNPVALSEFEPPLATLPHEEQDAPPMDETER